MSIKLKYGDEIMSFETEKEAEVYFDEKIREILQEEAEKIKAELSINEVKE